MGPVRDLASSGSGLRNIRMDDLPFIETKHFEAAFDAVSSSVSQADLKRYINWNTEYGSFRRME